MVKQPENNLFFLSDSESSKSEVYSQLNLVENASSESSYQVDSILEKEKPIGHEEKGNTNKESSENLQNSISNAGIKGSFGFTFASRFKKGQTLLA